MLTAPVVCFDVNKHSCIVVKATERKVFYIPMTSEGMDLVNDSFDKFTKRYSPSDYSVGRAAAHYLASTEVISMTLSARRQLESLTSPLDIEPKAVRAAAIAFVNTEREKKGLPRLDHEEAPSPERSIKENQMATAAKKSAAPTKEVKKTATTTKAVPAAAKTKAAPAKEVKKAAAPAAASGETRGRKPGVGAFIRELLLKNKETSEILMEVASKFPGSKASASDVSWNRSKLKKDGLL